LTGWTLGPQWAKVRGMDRESAIKHYGTARALARALGVSEGAVSQWKAVPRLRQYQLEVMTGGALRAERQEPPEKT